MFSKRWMGVVAVLGVLGAGALVFVDQRLKSQRWEREANFVALHFMAAEATRDGGEEPLGFEALAKYGRDSDSKGPLVRPFPEGLVYKWDGQSFTLEEPRARFVSLLKRDRLIATDRKWPRWERSGEYARKFAGQEVPVSGYE